MASNNQWNPRPVIQSYSVYTTKLAKINEQHLRGEHAPDNVLFRVQPIDGRLPSLEDGLSWPALFDNYTVTRLNNNLAYLHKKQTSQSSSTYDVVKEGTYRTGEVVALPITSAPIFAEIDLRLTFLGKVISFLFKPPQLKITMNFRDGTSKDYRVISNMMDSGFVLSPLVENTKDFVVLATGNQRFLEKTMAESFVVTPIYGGSIFWRPHFSLKLKAYRGGPASALPSNFYDSMTTSIPEGYVESKSTNCDGSIDIVNGLNPAPPLVKVANLLSVSGWLAVSGKDGVAPDDIFVTLKKPNGLSKYIKTHRMSRTDVKAYFKQPAMPDVGFSATVDVSMLNGEYVLGLSRGYKGKMVQCQQFKTVTFATEH